MMFSPFLAVFIGGGLGSIARFSLSLKLNPVHHAIPLGTLASNLIGGFIIGLALALITRLPDLDPLWRLVLITGFCGGLTTFSTFSSEVIYLLQEGRFSWALGNIACNLLGSLAMTALAFAVVHLASSNG